MAVRRRKINYMGSLAEFKQSVNDSQVDSGGGVASIMGGGVMPSVYSPNRPDTIVGGQSLGNKSSYPYYDFPDPYKPSKRRNRTDKSFRPVDRYPDPKVPAQMPPRPVDRYPEATPNKPRIPNPRKPKPKKPKSRSGGSRTQGIE